MSAVLPDIDGRDRIGPVRPFDQLLRSWRSLRPVELGLFLLIGGVLGGMNLLALDDSRGVKPAVGLMVSEVVMPIFFWLLLLVCWLPADRSAPESPTRTRRLVGAVLLATVLAALLWPPFQQLVGLPSAMELLYLNKGKPPPGWLAMFVANSLYALLPAALLIPALEMAGRNRRSEAAVAMALEEQSRLARATLESRLAAMQAQVEPQFLFDVLVDIERLYGAPDDAAAGRSSAHAQMERLITYLRVALPKLREAGSTLGAEIDLLASYLDLVQAMHEGQPRFVAAVDPALRQTTFHPMLLLPLVQRAIRSSASVPQRVELLAQASAQSLRLELSIAAPGLCDNDDELLRLRERLQVLYAGRASLVCEDRAADPPTWQAGSNSRFTMELPR